MTSNLPSTPILPDDQKLAVDGMNWSTWKEAAISMARGRGLTGYLYGTINNPTGYVASLYGTALNSDNPSPDEYLIRDGWVAAMLFQNMKDPRSHDITGSDTAHRMWTILLAKFNRSSELLIGMKVERLRELVLKDPRKLPAHIDKLVKRRTDVHEVGGTIPDPLMCTILLNSLPKEEFGTALISLQMYKVVADLVQHLRKWWDIVWKRRVEDEGVGTPLNTTNAMTINVSASACSNCGVNGHSDKACWAKGGGKEGQAPGWWKAPRRMEPSPALVSSYQQARQARRGQANPFSPPTANFASYGSQPIPPQINPSAMTTYVLAAEIDDYESDVEGQLLPF
ncbi:unnamed protein product [Mycena citricolor]|uniref:CCHC-type domain-containing protein n=1 Tax=Mycena citricolor TaxID=2018698 RepID=A0AAD2HTG8_9AGAR|nr:unnamed protein product [Mycena citricolor]